MLTAGLAEGSREGANAWANAWQIHTSLSESLMRMEKDITSWVISTARALFIHLIDVCI